MAAGAVAHSRNADVLARGCRMVPAASLTDVVAPGASRRWPPPSRSLRARERRRPRRSCGACRARCPGAARCGADAAGRVQEIATTCAGWPLWRRLSACALGRASAVVPGRFDQQSAAVPGAGLGDRALAACCRWSCSDGTSPRKLISCAARAKRAKSPTSAHSPTALSVSMPRRQRNRATVSAHGEPGTSSSIVASSVVAADQAACRSRRGSPAASPARLGGRDRRAPSHCAVTLRPRPALSSKRTSWRSSSLDSRCRARIRSPRTSSRARTESRSASSSQRRHPDRMQPADHQQPQQPLGVATVGLDAVSRRALDLPRRRAPRNRHPPPEAPAPVRTQSAPPHRPRAPDRAARHRTPRPRPSRPAAAHDHLPRLAIHLAASTLRA